MLPHRPWNARPKLYLLNRGVCRHHEHLQRDRHTSRFLVDLNCFYEIVVNFFFIKFQCLLLPLNHNNIQNAIEKEDYRKYDIRKLFFTQLNLSNPDIVFLALFIRSDVFIIRIKTNDYFIWVLVVNYHSRVG
jgi:hypothetical protein